ncbi:unnamed protein product [Durusdinium trenchii]|uniref:Rab-GAP TBC domain-containing protein n=1 Tax=Durusdinium trenchii TaxID=1381693 RepID=A0ABP0NHM7_9DINO
MDMARTFANMLIGREVVQCHQKVTDLMIQWLQKETPLTYMQGRNHVMAICFRELQEEDAALKVFDFVIRQADEDLFQPDGEKLYFATHKLAQELPHEVRSASPRLTMRFGEAEIDCMPMMVQSWMMYLFAHVLPTEAANRLWDHIFETQGNVVKFAAQLLLSGKQELLRCQEKGSHKVLSNLPSRVASPEDVDQLLCCDFSDERGGKDCRASCVSTREASADRRSSALRSGACRPSRAGTASFWNAQLVSIWNAGGWSQFGMRWFLLFQNEPSCVFQNEPPPFPGQPRCPSAGNQEGYHGGHGHSVAADACRTAA